MDGIRRFATVLMPWVLAVIVLSSCGKEEQALQGGFGPRPDLSITPYPIFDFGQVAVGQSKQQVFKITNVGGLPADSLTSSFDLSINFLFEGGSFPGTTGTCGSTLLPGDNCTVVISFAPQYTGSFSQGLRVSYSDGSRSWVTEDPVLQGKGI